MRILVSFAGKVRGSQRTWRARQRHLHRSALRHGIDRVEAWTRRRLQRTSFYRDHRALLDHKRGAGYWAWKPFIILSALQEASEGSEVVYWDVGRGQPGAKRVGHALERSIEPVIRWCHEQGGGILPGVPIPEHGPNRCWTKRDAFHFMGCDEVRYWEHPQVQATFGVWTRTAAALTIVGEWLAHATDPRVISDEPSTCGKPELPGFIEHRHDQSILTNLVVKHGLCCPVPPDQVSPRSKDLNALAARLAVQQGDDSATTRSWDRRPGRPGSTT